VVDLFLNVISRRFISVITRTSRTGPVVDPLITTDDVNARVEYILAE